MENFCQSGRRLYKLMKRCSKCLLVLDRSMFYKQKGGRDGLRAECKVCKKETLYRWRDADRESVNAARRKYTKNNPDKISQWNKTNYKKNRATRSANNQKRRDAVKAATKYIIVDKDINRIYSGSCVGCGSTDNITADHIVPLSRGGVHGIGNLMPLCKPCNSSKHNKLLSEWRYRNGRHN